MLLGRTKYSSGSTLQAGRYGDGSLALYTIDEDGAVELKITVNMEGTAAIPLPADCIWIKGWSENEGVPEAVVAAGIAELTGDRFVINEFCFATMAKLTPAALAWLQGENPDGR